ncbi:MAG: winged helix-turn-helix domain-containing protein [Microbacteriaceae bacterium]
MYITLNTAAAEPLFEQLSGELRRQIGLGILHPGERLPSARDLADSLEVNVHTVLRSYQDLRDEGLITMRPGRGAQVVGQPVIIGEIHQLLTQAVRLAQEHEIQAPTLISTIKELYK